MISILVSNELLITSNLSYRLRFDFNSCLNSIANALITCRFKYLNDDRATCRIGFSNDGGGDDDDDDDFKHVDDDDDLKHVYDDVT